ncbi:MAG TPA: VOC family protein [Solirubrobacterales bacterium]
MSNRLLSQLSHVELMSDKPAESVEFFVNVLGLEKSGEDGNSVYLRGWGDWLHHSMIITEGPAATVVRAGWRAEGAEELQSAVANLEAAGATGEWKEDTLGQGPSYSFVGPGGQRVEIFWEAERFEAPPELRSEFPNRPQRPSTRGVAARQIDHVTWGSTDPVHDANWYSKNLGFRFTEYVVLDEKPVFATVTTNEHTHDLGLLGDFSGEKGRVHHVAYWLDNVTDILRAAELLTEFGVPIEFGPGRHGMGESTYLYFREPGGMRIELFSGGFRNYLPDWKPVQWTPDEGANNAYRNGDAPSSFLHALPLTEEEIAAGAGDFANPISNQRWAAVYAGA